jgi:hypothetical protein
MQRIVPHKAILICIAFPMRAPYTARAFSTEQVGPAYRSTSASGQPRSLVSLPASPTSKAWVWSDRFSHPPAPTRDKPHSGNVRRLRAKSSASIPMTCERRDRRSIRRSFCLGELLQHPRQMPLIFRSSTASCFAFSFASG